MYNVLVCDDDSAILESIEIYLKAEGYNIITACDGVEALEKIEDNEIHCLVLDIMMPRMDGLKTTIAIRKNYNFPIILLSAKSEDTDKITGLGFGADDYVTKPFNPLELVARVKAQIRRFYQYNSADESMVNFCEAQVDSIGAAGTQVVTFTDENGTVVEIGNDVWVGNDVRIIGGVKIGDGAVIGSCALVTKDVEPYSIVGGVPAKVIKKRFSDDIISKLLETKWWNKDAEWISSNAEIFDNVENLLEELEK